MPNKLRYETGLRVIYSAVNMYVYSNMWLQECFRIFEAIPLSIGLSSMRFLYIMLLICDYDMISTEIICSANKCSGGRMLDFLIDIVYYEIII